MIKNFEKNINYYFNNKEIIKEALTHSSYANETQDNNVKFNERLEFLGDSVLSLVISNYLFKKFPDIPEGQLTKLRAKIVCEPSLADVARSIQLGDSLKLGRGEEITGGRTRTSILADGFEAVLAAIYIDNDFVTVEKFILDIMESKINQAVSGDLLLDYKTRLQEIIQSQTTKNLNYQLYDEKGPDHNKTFYVHVMLEDKILGSGKGSNKKEAEQQAAKEAIQEVDIYE